MNKINEIANTLKKLSQEGMLRNKEIYFPMNKIGIKEGNYRVSDLLCYIGDMLER